MLEVHVRKQKNVKQILSNSLHHTCRSILQHLYSHGNYSINIYKDSHNASNADESVYDRAVQYGDSGLDHAIMEGSGYF